VKHLDLACFHIPVRNNKVYVYIFCLSVAQGFAVSFLVFVRLRLLGNSSVPGVCPCRFLVGS